MLQKTKEEMRVLLGRLYRDLNGRGLLGEEEWGMDVDEFLRGMDDRFVVGPNFFEDFHF